MSLLTRGALEILRSGSDEGKLKLNIQILKIFSNQDESKVAIKAKDMKYRVLVTDGEEFGYANLAQQYNVDIKNGELGEFCVVQVSHFTNVMINNSR
jgi:homoserine trans-succinylase